MDLVKVKKGEFLQRKGERNSKVYYVKSGLLRSYTIDRKGKEHIFMFAPEDWIVSDSVSSDQPTNLYIDAIEDTVVTIRNKDFLEADNHQVNLLIRRMSVLQERIIMLMSASAIERYEHFVATYPNIVQRVPQKMIASYLGITPEALSKAKGEQFRKQKNVIS